MGTLNVADPEALPRAARALGRHTDDLRRTAEDANARARAVLNQIARGVDAHRRRVADLRRALAGAEPEQTQRVATMLAQAEGALRQAEAAERNAAAAADRTGRAVAGVVARSDELANRGLRHLQETYDALAAARGAFAAALRGLESRSASASPGGTIGGGSGGGVGAPGSSGASPAPSGSRGRPVGTAGHVMVALSDIDDSDSAVTGPGSFNGDRLSFADAMVAMSRLATVIDLVDRGGGAAEMEALDAARGQQDSPASYRRTYEGFFGSTSLRLSARPDGLLEVVNGYHRVYAARQAGLEAIPARIEGLR